LYFKKTLSRKKLLALVDHEGIRPVPLSGRGNTLDVHKSLRRQADCDQVADMRNILVLCCMTFFNLASGAATKPHMVVLGKWSVVKRLSDEDGSKIQDARVRPLVVDGRIREYALGPVHDVTERLFVVQRMFRLNDSLPLESGPVRWRWEAGGWLLVDRLSGKIQAINLPEFDPEISSVNWFRDYAAYCGIGDDVKKSFAMIVQLGRRKPVLKKPVDGDAAECGAPQWQRDPVRATFDPGGAQKFTFSVRTHAVDLVTEAEESASDQ
jgi:hypothetical protein